MIICNNIKKKYGNVTIFNNFSYSFNDTGLYVLYGVSGSGKTTLLQIILGITPFESGEIVYQGKVYNKKVSFKEIQKRVAYISQDTYFIDYLTIEENLLLQTNKRKEDILKIVDKFKMRKLIKKYPKELSQGERQRFCLIGNIIKNKKIFLLDEPTSSLDKKNKIIFYEMLKQIKDKCLIICASHDNTIFELGCEIIDFNKIDDYKIERLNKEINIVQEKIKVNYFFEIKKILNCLYKQIYRCEKKIFLLFILCFTFVLLLLFTCSDYNKKVINSLINSNDLNGTKIYCSIDSSDHCMSILSKYNVSEINYQYLDNIPDVSISNGMVSYNNFALDVLTLPFNRNNLKSIENILLYGHYFDDKKQVIIGFKEAQKLSKSYGISMEKLIGEKINIQMLDIEDEFEVVGIFKEIKKNNETYMKALIGQYEFDSYYYINGLYTEKYFYDNILGLSETNDNYPSVALTIYFENSSDFIKFYNDYINSNFNNILIRIDDPIDNFVEYSFISDKIQSISLVTSICFIILGLIFYYQIHKTRISYTEHNYSIFEYFGFSEKSVKISTAIYFISSIVGIVIISSVLAFFLSLVINQIVLETNILPFPLFVFSWFWVFILIILVILASFFESIVLNMSRKHKGWFYLIKEKSDLL